MDFSTLPHDNMRKNPQTWWIVAGAIAGGFIVGPFALDPGWLWGMVGGAYGGALGALTAFILVRRWPVWVRVPLGVSLFAAGLGALWMLAAAGFLISWVAATRTP